LVVPRHSPKSKVRNEKAFSFLGGSGLEALLPRYLSRYPHLYSITTVLDQGQANFREPGEFEAKAKDLTLEAKDFKNCPRGQAWSPWGCPCGQGRPRGRHLC